MFCGGRSLPPLNQRHRQKSFLDEDGRIRLSKLRLSRNTILLNNGLIARYNSAKILTLNILCLYMVIDICNDKPCALNGNG